MQPLIGLSATLSAFWLLLSGHYTPLLLSLGAASVVLVVWLSRRMDIADHEAEHLQFGRRIAGYWLWLIREVMSSSWDTTKRSLARRPAVEPVVYTLLSPGHSVVAMATYANSLTLTPGTLAIRVEADRMLVHALHPDLAPAVADDTMGARVRALGLD